MENENINLDVPIFVSNLEELNKIKNEKQRVIYKCLICGKECSFRKRSSSGLLCKKHKTDKTRTAKDGPDWAKKHYQRAAEHNLEKYGCKNVSQISEIKEKKVQTYKQHYGEDSQYGQAEEIKQKRAKTNLEKFGFEYPAKNAEVIQKLKDALAKRTDEQKKEIFEKTKQTCLEKYGREYPVNVEKAKQTCLERYGYESAAQVEEFKEKARKTCLERYGVDNYSKSEEWQKRRFKRFIYNDEYFDSSWELALYIYYTEHNMPIERNKRKFLLENGHYCFPDFITEEGLIEVKSDYLRKLEDWEYKQSLYEKEHIKVLFYEDIKSFISYVIATRDEDFLKTYKFLRYKNDCQKS